ncbi:MAG: hypothetical protein ACRCYS_20045 [Beijerinckiaceae bacterium]
MADFVVCGFKTEYRGERAIDWVEIAPSGEAFDRTKTWHRIKDLTPPLNVDDSRADSMAHKVMVARWNIIAPKYEAWKRKEDIPVDGLPLAAWSGVSPEQAAHLKAMGIMTVEGVRDMGEGVFARLPFPNARQLPKMAASFLSSLGEAEKDKQLAEMAERMAIMEEMLAAQMPEKRGPGRPKKEPEAA